MTSTLHSVYSAPNFWGVVLAGAYPASGPLLKPLARTSLSEDVYRVLRTLIIRGRLEPGSRIVESRVGSVLGVSRTPVREALQRLEYDGLLDNHPGHSPRVTHLTLEDIDEIYPLIGALEGLAARLAAPRLSDRDLAHMEELTNQMNRHQRRGEIDKLLRTDTEFHAVLHERSRNERLKKIVAELRGQMERFEYFYFSTPKSFRVSVKRHRHLVQVLRRRNPAKAQKTLLRQWELGRQGLVEVIRKKTAILEASAGDELADALRDRARPARARGARAPVRPGPREEILTFKKNGKRERSS